MENLISFLSSIGVLWSVILLWRHLKHISMSQRIVVKNQRLIAAVLRQNGINILEEE